MPLFDYACQKCDHNFEALVFGQESVECPKCNATEVEKMLSLPARPHSTTDSLPMSCGEGPPCGAPGCRRTG